MGRARQKGRASVFILFTPKWTKIKDPNKIEKRKARALFFTLVNAQLSDSNRLKASLLSQIVNAKNSFYDLEWTAGFDAGFNVEFDENADLFLGVLATEVDQDQKQKKKKLKASQTDAFKRGKLSNEIFYYIYAARCQKLFYWLGTMIWPIHKATIFHLQKPCPQVAVTDQVVILQSLITSNERRLSIQAFQKPLKPIKSR